MPDHVIPPVTVLPDPPDFRDRIYSPTLKRLSGRHNASDLQRRYNLPPVQDQGATSACTGFALAGMVECLLRQACLLSTAEAPPHEVRISPHMLYYFARRHDDLPGENLKAGSTARGAMKAWHKHGACLWENWKTANHTPFSANAAWASTAFEHPLGAYYRVDHTSIADLHAAISETGIVYATASIHPGWSAPDDEGGIAYGDDPMTLGGHAFLLVGYDEVGFWVQNSWGTSWGREGFARISYRDWTANAMDAWVAQLGVRVSSLAHSVGSGLRLSWTKGTSAGADAFHGSISSDPSLGAQQINPYIVNLGNGGVLSDSGQFATRREDLVRMAEEFLPNALRAWACDDTQPIPVAIYAHGGLTRESAAADTARVWVPALFNQRIFPIFVMWETGLRETVANLFEDALKDSRNRGAAGTAFWDRLLDSAEAQLNRRLESLTRAPGTLLWSKMKSNALAASAGPAAGLNRLISVLKASPLAKRLRFHLIGHSAGSILHAGLAPRLVKAGLTVSSVQFLAPACQVELFQETFQDGLFQSGAIPHYTQFELTDRAELDDNCGGIYRQSLLYLVSNAFERGTAVPILGMEKFSRSVRDKRPAKMLTWDWVSSPNETHPADNRSASTSHGGFDNDDATRAAVLARITRFTKPAAAPPVRARARRKVRRR